MAGMGSRFRDIGINKPKHEIIANGKTLFEWSVLSLSDFFDEEFVFVCRKSAYDTDNLTKLCAKLGISKFNIAEVAELTDGQARTVMFAGQFINCTDDFAVYNIDTAVKPNVITKAQLKGFDGFVPSFPAEGSHWSFIRVDNDRIVNIAEKVRISNLGTIGFYYFGNWGEYCRIIVEKSDEIKKNNKELYIAPVYKYLLNSGKKLGYSIIDPNDITNLGTPDEVQAFDENYEAVNK
jgi:dTDP-glucose pyrophosphorylase